tara:strand:- start:1776 stop:2357 length:582 start_codon:yes stop_codon:yes gene_type:complete
MSSRLIVNSIRHTGASSDAITFDNTGKCAFPNNTGNILQVVQAVKTDNASLSVTQGSIVDLAGAGVSGLSPQMAVSTVGNKVLIIPTISLSGISGGLRITFTVGGSVSTFIGDAAGSRQRVSLEGRSGSDSNSSTFTGLFLYTPSNTNNTTYGVAVSHADNATHTLRINGANTGDHNYTARQASSITLMEVAG